MYPPFFFRGVLSPLRIGILLGCCHHSHRVWWRIVRHPSAAAPLRIGRGALATFAPPPFLIPCLPSRFAPCRAATLRPPIPSVSHSVPPCIRLGIGSRRLALPRPLLRYPRHPLRIVAFAPMRPIKKLGVLPRSVPSLSITAPLTLRIRSAIAPLSLRSAPLTKIRI